MRSYNIFISHSWSYSDTYKRLIALLRKTPYFSFKDFSVPKDDPIHNTPNTILLERAIKTQMGFCNAILVLAGVYATYSKWIKKEINIARNGFDLTKRVIAIEPRGSGRTSEYVKSRADFIVGWNGKSISQAIKGNSTLLTQDLR